MKAMLASRWRTALVVVGVVAVALVPIVSDNLYVQNTLIVTFLLAVGASGWNIMGGYAGYISLGNSVFVGIGGYATAVLAVKLDIPPFIGIFAGGLLAGAAAALLSLVTRRTRGMYFIIVSYAALVLVGLIVRFWGPVTGGSQGLAMPLPTWDIAYQNWPFYYSLLAVLIVTVAVSFQIKRSKLGAGLFAIRDDEEKAAGLGIRTAVYKAIAFVAASTLTGLAGGIYAYFLSYLNPAGMFDIVLSMLMLLSALLGGRGTVWGPVLGAFIVEPLAQVTTTNIGGANSGAVRLLLFAGILLVVVLFLPKGIIPTIAARLGRTRDMESLRVARLGGAPGAAVPGSDPEFLALEPTGTPNGTDLLEVRGVSKAFGGVKAVGGVDLSVPRGGITGLIGPNGSGKTTLFNLIDGTIRLDAGTVTLAGTSLEKKRRADRAHAGLARTYQLPRLFPSLTVLENVLVPERHFGFLGLFRSRLKGQDHDRALALLGQFGLAGFADISPAELSYGQRKLVELGQVLSLNPSLVMLDEPAAGISPALSMRLQEIVRGLNSRGVSILLVEHDLAFIGALCDNVYVMSNGLVIGEGTVEELNEDAAVIDAYLGEPSAHNPKMEVAT